MPSGFSHRWDDGLKDPALRIAGTDQTPLRVTAGPGTGKTFCLMRRVARLLQEDVSPRKIFVCTFTRTAALSLKDELSNLGVEGSDKVWTSTLHSYCFWLLGQADVLSLTGRVPRPLLPKAEERFLLEDLKYRKLGGITELRKALAAFNGAWARLQSEEPGWPITPEDQRLHVELLGWLRFHQAILIGELIPEALRFLRANPESSYRGMFEHVLVDEYQDLNKAEQVLLDEIALSGTLAIIGDEDQSIYSFKCAHPEGISTFPESHPGCTNEKLLECRRCPRTIVEMANALIAVNENRTPRELQISDANPQGEVHIVQWPGMGEEAAGVAEFVRHKVQSGEVKPGSVLVLAPRRQFGYAIRNALNAAGVPAHSFFQEEALDGDPTKAGASEAQVSFSLLTLLAKPEDRVALRCWCGYGSPSLNAGAWDRVRRHCEQTGESPRVVLDQLLEGTITLPHIGALLARYRMLLKREAELEGLKGDDLVDTLFPPGAEWSEPFRAVAAQIEEADVTASELYDIQLINVTQPELPVDVEYVRIMSLHKSKGLTADMVVVAGCIEGLIPSYNDGLTPEEAARHLEEQRRLFYVAVTRARKTLLLSSVTTLELDVAYKMRARVRPISKTQSRTIASTFTSQLGESAPSAIKGRQLLRGLS